MSGMVGADVEQLRALAGSFERAAEQLRQTSTKVRNGIQISAWVGPFAVRFRKTWDSEHSVKLTRAATALSAQARQLRQEADQQASASAESTALRFAAGRLSDRDLVDFARSGTSDQTGISKNGYTLLNEDELRELGIDPGLLHGELSGFDAKVYRDAAGKIVVSFGGTELTDAQDAGNDIIGAVIHSPQTASTLALALAVTKAAGSDNVVFTGHSLGGRNAAIASLATGARAVTFNAAGVSAADYAFAAAAGGDPSASLRAAVGTAELTNPFTGQQLGRAAPNVTNYSTSTDPLTFGQNVTAFPNAVGDQHEVHSDNSGMAAHDDWEALRSGVPD